MHPLLLASDNVVAELCFTAVVSAVLHTCASVKEDDVMIGDDANTSSVVGEATVGENVMRTRLTESSTIALKTCG